MNYAGRLTIDNKDAFTYFGVFVERWGYKALIQMPPFKNPDSTEWEEYDGAEYDLEDPVLDAKTFQMQFCVTNVTQVSDLFFLLSDKSYHIFNFVELGRSFKLRLSQNSTISSKVSLGKFTISLVDDFPPIRYQAGMSNAILNQAFPRVLNVQPYETSVIKMNVGYDLDDVDFGRMGVNILDGTNQNILKSPNVRENLKVSIKGRSGVEYDDENVFYKARDVQMKVLIHAGDITDFWHRYDSLFTILIQPETRSLLSWEVAMEYECFYKSCQITKFDILNNGHVWCEFTLTLTFVADRPVETEWLLASEDMEWILTEENENFVLLDKNR